jgi:branched-chain amino acid transport system ATP-binding protein
MLELKNINCFYGAVQVLRELSLKVEAGRVLCVLGRNGAGKTTMLKTIMGLLKPRSGGIFLDDIDLMELPAHEVPVQGIAYVPQGRRLFADLSVRENLEIGLMARRKGEETLQRVLSAFPVLGERLRQRAGTLSGGEQQMLAMARALCLEPKVMLLDEPTEGLMPSMIAKVRDSVRMLRKQGVATVLVEQRVEAVLPVADRVAFMETGRIRAVTDVAALRDDPALLHRYVGVGH